MRGSRAAQIRVDASGPAAHRGLADDVTHPLIVVDGRRPSPTTPGSSAIGVVGANVSVEARVVPVIHDQQQHPDGHEG
jgi:hypothetical protein